MKKYGHRENPWLYEQDHDLNPTWIFVTIYLALGVAMSIGALLTGNPYAIGGALAFVGSVIMALLISALPRDKAKILAKSRLPSDVARGIAGGGSVPLFGIRTDTLEDEEDAH